MSTRPSNAIRLACAGMFVGAGLLLSSCNSGTDAVNGGVKFGNVSNDCGPTDGPETRLVLTDAPLECGGSSFPQTSAYLHVPSLAELKVGSDSTYENREAWLCRDASGCEDLGSLTVHFTDSTATTLGGEFLIQKNGQTLQKGRFEVGKCSARPTCG